MKKLFVIISLFLFLPRSYSQNFWQQTNGPYGRATVNDFLLVGDSTIFIATNEGLIKSTNNGDSWIRINSDKVTCLGKDKISNLYFSISGHLNRSTDGANWEKLSFNGYGQEPITTINDSIIIVGSSGVYVSNDSGKTWTNTANYAVKALFYDCIEQIVYLGTSRDLTGIFGIYTSYDFGQSWQLLHTFPNTGQVSWVNALHISKNNHQIFANV